MGGLSFIEMVVCIVVIAVYILACRTIANAARDKGHGNVSAVMCFFFGIPYMVSVMSLPDLKKRNGALQSASVTVSTTEAGTPAKQSGGTSKLVLGAAVFIVLLVGVPYINSTMESKKIAEFESDAATMNMLTKEAINTYKAGIKTTTFNGKTADTCTIGDIIIQYDLSNDVDGFLQRTIGKDTYNLVYVESITGKTSGNVQLSGGDMIYNGKKLTANTTIVSLAGSESSLWGGSSSSGYGSYYGSYSSKYSSGFTNKYGTSTTICAHPGCSNYIAKSGDTNCCPLHSNHCAICGKYIDEDATYCMDCIYEALKNY